MASIAVPAMLLAGCATATPAPRTPGADEAGERACDVGTGQDFVGRQATSEIGARLLEATGAAQLRWAPPRSAMTMDFRPDRLTIEYDDDMVIIRIACG